MTDTTREPRTRGFDRSECGRFVEPTAYHPYTYCVLHRAGVSIQQARADLGAAPPPAEAVEALREALYIAKEHRLCGTPYEGCYSHFSFMDHCRADGMRWPCDVEAIRRALAPRQRRRSHDHRCGN